LGFGWLWECRSRLEDRILLGAGNQKGEAVDLLWLAGFEEFGRVGVYRLQIGALLGYRLCVAGWRGRCPIGLYSVVSKGRAGWS